MREASVLRFSSIADKNAARSSMGWWRTGFSSIAYRFGRLRVSKPNALLVLGIFFILI